MSNCAHVWLLLGPKEVNMLRLRYSYAFSCLLPSKCCALVSYRQFTAGTVKPGCQSGSTGIIQVSRKKKGYIVHIRAKNSAQKKAYVLRILSLTQF